MNQPTALEIYLTHITKRSSMSDGHGAVLRNAIRVHSSLVSTCYTSVENPIDWIETHFVELTVIQNDIG